MVGLTDIKLFCEVTVSVAKPFLPVSVLTLSWHKWPQSLGSTLHGAGPVLFMYILCSTLKSEIESHHAERKTWAFQAFAFN